jgi:DnaJ-class molecular chaperone
MSRGDQRACSICRATGIDLHCPKCWPGGNGKVLISSPPYVITCSVCKGTGEYPHPCTVCQGTGRVTPSPSDDWE